MSVFLNSLSQKEFCSLLVAKKLGGFFFKTRMHSSRMRTVRCSDHLGGGGGGGVWGSAQGVSSWGGLPEGGVCPGGVHLPPPRGQTDTCENITFPQLLLGTVIKCYRHTHNDCISIHWLYTYHINRSFPSSG